MEDGFYYDFERPRRPTEEDQAWVEERMKELAKGRHPFTVREVSADEARQIFGDQPFKLELIDGLAGADGGEGERITLYQHDTFVDLCRGPHVRHTGYIQPNAIKLMSVSGAYWRGDEKRESLFRFYGTAWRNKTELTAYLERLEEAKRATPQAGARAGALHHTTWWAPASRSGSPPAPSSAASWSSSSCTRSGWAAASTPTRRCSPRSSSSRSRGTGSTTPRTSSRPSSSTTRSWCCGR